jgi:proliferating cell nuclear antigen
LKLIEINEATIHIPRVEFPSVITMPSATFQKVCREMSNISDKIEITSQGDRLILGCDGEFADQETVMKETTDGMHFMKQENPKDIIQGVFNLNHLILFTKCSGLCNTIEIYLKNEYPLIILYRVASLGEIKLCLAPELSS